MTAERSKNVELREKVKILEEEKKINEKLSEYQNKEEINKLRHEIEYLRKENREYSEENQQMKERMREYEVPMINETKMENNFDDEPQGINLGSDYENSKLLMEDDTKLNIKLGDYSYNKDSFIKDGNSKKEFEYDTNAGLLQQLNDEIKSGNFKKKHIMGKNIMKD